MFDLQKRLERLREQLAENWQKQRVDEKITQYAKIDEQLASPEVWRDVEHARALASQSKQLRDELDEWRILRTQADDMDELLKIYDDSLAPELSEQLASMEHRLAGLVRNQRFTGKFDANNVIMRVTAGAGGTDAMDWAQMLVRMYLHWADDHGIATDIVHIVPGEEAGLKTAIVEFTGGSHLFGKLKSEHGVHRLVRLSPFNADHLRQTSFAQVEVLPMVEADELAIDPKDLRIDTFHAGGHGGQSVNTTDSAVRVTHIPTNLSVTIQTERSQQQNKERALKVLRARLEAMLEEQHAASLSELRAGESASWGAQIRNYVLHPYKLVKDLRSGHQEKDAEKVLDGDIDPFIYAYLDK